MWYLECEPQRSRPEHPWHLERLEHEQSKRDVHNLLTALGLVTMLLFLMTATALHVVGLM